MHVEAHITKSYGEGSARRIVLDDVSLELSSPSLVAVLGESGCGKTTLLNILGGLDLEYEGSVLVDGTETSSFSQGDWDRYRGARTGIVFQSPKLIGHLSVLENVRMAQDLAGLAEVEARRMADEALRRCGIEGLAHTLPAKLSGGQAQRASVARALAKDPDVILADEPTGSLDDESGRAVMELLADLARDRLVVMVTHNERLARKYATRILRISGGQLHEETKGASTSPQPSDEAPRPKSVRKVNAGRDAHRRMASLALSHALRKRLRSLLSFSAGAISATGIILMLAIGLGCHAFLESLARSMALMHPIVASADVGLGGLVGTEGAEGDVSSGLTVDPSAADALRGASDQGASPDLGALYAYLTTARPEVPSKVMDIQRDYELEINLYDEDGTQLLRAGKSVLADDLAQDGLLDPSERDQADSALSSLQLMSELVVNDVTGESPYELVAGHMPQGSDEVVLIVDGNGCVSDVVAMALGLIDEGDLADAVESGSYATLELDEVIGMSYRIVSTASYYRREGTVWVDARDDALWMNGVLDDARELTIVGVVVPDERCVDTAFYGSIGYAPELIEALVQDSWDTGVVRAQAADPTRSVFTGLSFDGGQADLSVEEVASLARDIGLEDEKVEIVERLDASQIGGLISRMGIVPDTADEIPADIARQLQNMSVDEFERLVERYATADLSANYEQNMTWLGGVDLDSPTSLRIYVDDAEGRELVFDCIDTFNDLGSGSVAPVSCATDIEHIVNDTNSTVATIDLALVVLSVSMVTISLFLVASTTSISALERTGEIAVLRALGATRGDVTALFLYENLAIGLTAGLVGSVVSIALAPVLEAYVTQFTSVEGLIVIEPWVIPLSAACCALVTAVAGLFPSLRAARRDPAETVRDDTV